jgi:hypothetical protein
MDCQSLRALLGLLSGLDAFETTVYQSLALFQLRFKLANLRARRRFQGEKKRGNQFLVVGQRIEKR